MDHKALKQDLTYALKKMQKDGKVLTAHDDNLFIDKGSKTFVAGDQMGPLEAFVMMKGIAPTNDHLSTIGCNISLLDLLSNNTGISKNDWYSFLDGFDNVVSFEKNDFYNVGTYLREKFSPVGMRQTPLEIVFQKEFILTGEVTNKFVIYSFKGKTAVMEVKCERLISMLEPAGEYRARILAPETLFEKKKDGTLVPSIYMSHALFDSATDALFKVEKDIESSFERNLRKKGIAYIPADIQAQLLLVKVINL